MWSENIESCSEGDYNFVLCLFLGKSGLFIGRNGSRGIACTHFQLFSYVQSQTESSSPTIEGSDTELNESSKSQSAADPVRELECIHC